MRMKKVFYKGTLITEILFDEEKNRLVYSNGGEVVPILTKGDKIFIELSLYKKSIKFKLKKLIIERGQNVYRTLFGYPVNVESCTHNGILDVSEYSDRALCDKCGVNVVIDEIYRVTEDNLIDVIHQLRLKTRSLVAANTPLTITGLSIKEVEEVMKKCGNTRLDDIGSVQLFKMMKR